MDRKKEASHKKRGRKCRENRCYGRQNLYKGISSIYYIQTTFFGLLYYSRLSSHCMLFNSSRQFAFLYFALLLYINISLVVQAYYTFDQRFYIGFVWTISLTLYSSHNDDATVNLALSKFNVNTSTLCIIYLIYRLKSTARGIISDFWFVLFIFFTIFFIVYLIIPPTRVEEMYVNRSKLYILLALHTSENNEWLRYMALSNAISILW